MGQRGTSQRNVLEHEVAIEEWVSQGAIVELGAPLIPGKHAEVDFGS